MNGDKYTGNFKNDFEEGKGKKVYFQHPAFLELEGEWKRGVADGKCFVKL